MLDKTDWAHLIPHAGTMCLLDAVVAWSDASIHAVSGGHADTLHPLRTDEGLHAVHLAEYGAQAMAVHGALGQRVRGVEVARGGRLVSLRDLKLEVEYVDAGAGRLDVHAERLAADDSGAQYVFRVEQAGQLLASGRAAVLYVDA
ncbi:Predicted 3-hydroxylacyl-ACP dehydratase, HotDog domain [Dyella sp. OK004]|uniref:phosphotransferase n=1 Tax=Dyella sp. OK004 TaxID=1855292 RepID=UPI0008EA8FB1|nr:phosphotransferase [Dyella sp. OK004]SFR93909.1 Predicted 3-hydroxylacyl-ACP dehydratase, HotDog domain [Dyella sp. OK004]